MVKNGYPSSLLNKPVSFFLNKLFAKPTTQPTADNPTKTYQIILTYLGIFTSRAEKKIKRALNENFPSVKFSFLYRASAHYSSSRTKFPSYLRSNIIYKYMCNSWKAVYIGESFRHQKSRFSEHM